MQTQSKKPLRSFGRIKARRIRDDSQRLLDELLPRLAFTTPRKGRELWLEIGFGTGDHLVGQAAANPQADILGAEPFVNGVAITLREVEKQGLTNVFIHNGDVHDILEKVPKGALSKVFVLFPDPWPKARHHKRRIIQAHMLDILADKLVPGGGLRLATDHAEYGQWMEEKLGQHPRFKLICKTYEAPADHIETKYQKKGLAGKTPVFFDFIKVV